MKGDFQDLRLDDPTVFENVGKQLKFIKLGSQFVQLRRRILHLLRTSINGLANTVDQLRQIDRGRGDLNIVSN